MPITSRIATLALALLLCGGCHSALSPTPAERHASFRRREADFTGDSVRSVLQTFLVVTPGPGGGSPTLDPAAGTLTLSGGSGGTFDQGLAVAIDRSGYLLTARHILGETSYVVGWMDGHLGVVRARIVASGPGDLALIAVAMHPDFAARMEAPPGANSPVFAIACNYTHRGIGGELTLVGGTLAAAGDNALTSDIPLWYGDSGGPLLGADGGLIGINSSIRFSWLNGGGYVRLCCPIDGALVRRWIAADREKAAHDSGLRR